jgi:hypothetical protein
VIAAIAVTADTTVSCRDVINEMAGHKRDARP